MAQLSGSVWKEPEEKKKGPRLSCLKAPVLRGVLHLRSWFRWVFCFRRLLIDAQLSMHNRKALRANVGLWPWREAADETAAQCHYWPIKDPLGRPRCSHQHTPSTQLKRKTFKFPPLSWAEINPNSIHSARIPTEQVIAHNRSGR